MAKKDKISKGEINDIVADVMQSLNSEFKDDDFEFADKQDFVSKIEWLSSGIYSVNYALSGNAFKGLPFGKVISLVGDSNSGKSLLSQAFIKETQKLNGIAVIFDVERGIEKSRLQNIGIDTSKVIISKSNILEDIFEKAIFFIKAVKDKTKDIPLTIVIDSISMACSRHELAEGFDKTDMKRAQNIKKGLRMMNALVSDRKVCFIIINHQIANVGVMYGPAKVTAGGSGVEYIPSIVIEVAKGKQILNEEDKPIGVGCNIRVKKTRLHIPFIKCEIEIYFNRGFESTSGLFTVLEQTGVVIKTAQGWYAFAESPDEKLRESDIMSLVGGDPEKYLKKLDTAVQSSAAEITDESIN